jgi:hypothetical protein
MIGVQTLGERQGDDVPEKALECWDDCGVDCSLVSKHWPTTKQLAPHETRGLLLGHHTLTELWNMLLLTVSAQNSVSNIVSNWQNILTLPVTRRS